jgi:hypothetical protein
MNIDSFSNVVAEASAFSSKLLSKKRAILGKGKRLASVEETVSFVGSTLQSAGAAFLETIHSELPEPQRRFTDIGSSDNVKEKKAPAQVFRWKKERPELTVEYLKSIGYSVDIA